MISTYRIRFSQFGFRLPRCSRKASVISSKTDELLHIEKPAKFDTPALDSSLSKYLQYTKPLVDGEQWNNTKKVVEEFLQSPESTKLQKYLTNRARMGENWLFDWWLSSYLEYRVPVVIHSSPGVRLPSLAFRTDLEWLTHAAQLVHGVIKYKEALEDKSFALDRLSDGQPMCMQQHYNMLGNCRIPGLPEDRLVYRRGDAIRHRSLTHYCVFYRNRPYYCELWDPTTKQMGEVSAIIHQLEQIVNLGNSKPVAEPVGLFTTLQRDSWANVHRSLKQHLRNANILTVIERSIIVLCLDETAELPPPAPDSAHRMCMRDTTIAANALHGAVGSNLLNSGNRWFDKSIQFIVSRDGAVGLNFEHTPADGPAICALIDSALQATQEASITDKFSRLPPPMELSWKLEPHFMEDLVRSGEELKELVTNTELQCASFNSFGSPAMKELKVSPDAFVQMAIQLAYARLHQGEPPPPTYESGSLRRFHLGRTDTIRSCSSESVAFTQAMLNPDVPPADVAALLRAAIEQHRKFTNDVISGHGFDRHLLGLRIASASMSKSPTDLPSLFKDPTYATANHYRISSSQVRSPHNMAVCFGPAVNDGYGVCYNVMQDAVHLSACSFRLAKETVPPAQFLTEVCKSLDDMYELLKSS